MINQIKNYYNDKIRPNLRDVRFIGLMVFLFIMLLVTWSGVKSVQTNYELQKQITYLQQQNDLQKLKNDNLRLKNSYYSTNQYVELSARQNFGLQASGETEVIIPKSVALRQLITLSDDQNAEISIGSQSAWQKHFEEWINFFMNR